MPEIADIFRAAGGRYRARFGARMLPSHLRAMRDIESCRTPALGGHLYRCSDCHNTEFAYHSCRNRSCPTCQGDRSEHWAEAHKRKSLPCDYFLFTFTLPETLRPLARSHQKEAYDRLLRCAAQSIQKLAKDPRYLGGQPGMIGVLHTWTRDLRYHPHAHFLVTAGGLSPDGLGWRPLRNPRFFMPGRALSVVFRAKLRDALAAVDLLDCVPAKTWKQKWVVHVQSAGRGDKMIEYLSRYLFRPPISNRAIVNSGSGQVTFRYRDGQTRRSRRCTVTTGEFIRRFLVHVLPRGFTRIRHYGCFSPGSAKKLAHARTLLEGLAATAPEDETAHTLADVDATAHADHATQLRTEHGDEDEPGSDDTPSSERRCPVCKRGTMLQIGEIPRPRRIVCMQRGPP